MLSQRLLRTLTPSFQLQGSFVQRSFVKVTSVQQRGSFFVGFGICLLTNTIVKFDTYGQEAKKTPFVFGPIKIEPTTQSVKKDDVLFGIWTKRKNRKAKMFEYVNSTKLNTFFFVIDNLSRGKDFFRFQSQKFIRFTDIYFMVLFLTQDFFPILDTQRKQTSPSIFSNVDVRAFMLDLITILSPKDVGFLVSALSRYVQHRRNQDFNQEFKDLLTKLQILVKDKDALERLEPSNKSICLSNKVIKPFVW